MKEFTEKEINIFLDYIKDEILECDYILDDPAASYYIAEKVCKELKEDVVVAMDYKTLSDDIDNIFASDIILAKDIIPFAKQLNRVISSRMEYNVKEKTNLLDINVNSRKELISVLGLRDIATDEQVIEHVKELLKY